MIIRNIVGPKESHPVYQELERSNGVRHYDFLNSVISTSISIQYNRISHEIIKAVNYHAIACLHENAGEYRKIPVSVNGNDFPPRFEQVPALMDELVSDVNDNWNNVEVVGLASFVMWKINQIHPFVNGNGRTARALCYYILCTKIGIRQLGNLYFPELVKKNFRDQYVLALKESDKSDDSTPLANLVREILVKHILQGGN